MNVGFKEKFKDAPTVLIVDDDPDICSLLSYLMKREGYVVEIVHDGMAALELMRNRVPDIILTDLRMPRMDGFELLKQVKLIKQDLPVVILTAYAGVHGAVESMKEGADDYLAKPFDNSKVVMLVHRILLQHNCYERGKLNEQPIEGGVHDIVTVMGPSAIIHTLAAQVKLVAQSNFNVIIQGATGVGKEVVAQAIHAQSPYASGPFVPVDCGAIPEMLLESELFGHEKGAFTGAYRAKQGKFEAARGGTLFLDEIANMPLTSQAKILRVMQEKIIFPVGSNQPIKIDVRLIVASHENLEAKVAEGTFREDLYYRFNEFTIKVPLLSERKEDQIYLAKRFMNETNRELGKNVTLSIGAINKMQTYEWRGNVRELRAVIRRAVLLAQTEIREEHLSIRSRIRDKDESGQLNGINFTTASSLPLKEIVRDCSERVEKKTLAQVLRETNGNKAKAARILKIDYKTLLNKVKYYELK
ncbi:two component, sigma54 specific, transcriptional regulator, Fis family protein [Psychromonas ingrahamii 37]|uniref:Two component, sigma54 specific, transcriptional regulator, Fis family protein n=1 Tax=Psychromonas ingrahamii (strain DSM 17664 / CCUG 51855 / 37) TaxID=357804 RepID=A1SUB0_PSYIN|nr:sigma-54 dependent transcriptional regulator [Psychromonas ingrahamii]ABM03075.1 two component, sigma54 specific, transcriptional regulator, Fis family protein [Psychromonas ingrahamii 37]